MDKEQSIARKLPNVQFRVLIAGRANAGKTTILQRVCETTDSPEIWRTRDVDGEEIREQIPQLDPTSERGQHDVSDELVFTKHPGYVFHDSRGFENGDEDQLKIIQDFVRERSQRARLQERLHAIWFCIPTDNHRPGLNIAPFNNICPDKNVPVIAVFTKYEALRHITKCNLQDDDEDDGDDNVLAMTEKIFEKEYLGKFDEKPRFVRLADMHELGSCCHDLIDTTMDALNDRVVTVMLLSVQRENLQFSIRAAVKWALEVITTGDSIMWLRECLKAFPYLWLLLPNLLFNPPNNLNNLLPNNLPFNNFNLNNNPNHLNNFNNPNLNDPIIHALLASPLHHVLPRTSPRFLIIGTIIVLHHATLLVAHRRITKNNAVQQAVTEYSNSPIGVQIQEWLPEFPAANQDEIVEFINGNLLPVPMI